MQIEFVVVPINRQFDKTGELHRRGARYGVEKDASVSVVGKRKVIIMFLNLSGSSLFLENKTT